MIAISKNKKSLTQQVYETLESKARYGHSKHQDKADGIAQNYIYSFDTMKTYKKHCVLFANWCRETIPRETGKTPRTLEECRPYAERWVLEREGQGLSAYTVKMERSALSKLFGEQIDVVVKNSHRADIKRSRGVAVRDAHFSEKKNFALVTFCRCAGPRRAELEKLDASALEIHEGKPYIRYTEGTKGGRERLSPLIGSDEELRIALDFLKTCNGDNHVPGACDVHSYRAEYATRIYNAEKGDLQSLKGKKVNYTDLTGKRSKNGDSVQKSALYYCRGDRKGDVLDRAAMIKASQALGHNRESVVGEHYIRL